MTCANCTCSPEYLDHVEIMMKFDDEISAIRKEFASSLEKHEPWDGHSLMEKFEIISREYMEAAAARDFGDIHGEHGVINELRQTAAMCIKTIITEGK